MRWNWLARAAGCLALGGVLLATTTPADAATSAATSQRHFYLCNDNHYDSGNGGLFVYDSSHTTYGYAWAGNGECAAGVAPAGSGLLGLVFVPDPVHWAVLAYTIPNFNSCVVRVTFTSKNDIKVTQSGSLASCTAP